MDHHDKFHALPKLSTLKCHHWAELSPRIYCQAQRGKYLRNIEKGGSERGKKRKQKAGEKEAGGSWRRKRKKMKRKKQNCFQG